MSKVIDPEMLGDMRRFGDLDVSACFSCGTCTAMPLVRAAASTASRSCRPRASSRSYGFSSSSSRRAAMPAAMARGLPLSVPA